MVHYDSRCPGQHLGDAVIGFILTKDPHLLFIARTGWLDLNITAGAFWQFYEPRPRVSAALIGNLLN